MKKRIISCMVTVFAFLTAYLMVYAFWHRNASENIFLVLSAYALLAVLMAYSFNYYWQGEQRRHKESAQRRFKHMVENLSAPALLWDDALNKVIINEKLREIAELEAREEGYDPKFLVPWIFGKTTIEEQDIQEILTAKDREFSFVANKGTPHEVIWNTAALETDDNGISVFLTIGYDLANIRIMESKLQSYSKRLAASEGRHALSMELTEIGILIGEQGSDTMFLSSELQTMLGIQKNSITVEELRKHVYPMDMAIFDNHIQMMRTGMSQYLDEIHIMEIRLCGADGLYRWYVYRYKATRVKGSNKLAFGGAILDNTKIKEKDEKIERIAYEDPITKISNRSKLMLMGQELYACTKDIGSAYWVIVIDIDRFHLINDTCGYESANELLRDLARSLTRTLGLGGFGARISGDNFALILHSNGDDNLPIRAIQKIQQSLASLAVGKFVHRSLSCSAGYAQMPRDGQSFEQVLEHAEFALSSGAHVNGSIRAYTKEMHDRIIRESTLEKQLVDAVQRREFVLYYQPKISLQDGSVMGMEALIRWHRPDGTVLPPSEFIPIAERSQIITQITRFVLYEACRQTRIWQDMGLPKLIISINMSSADFYQENLSEQVMNALIKNGVAPQYLEIELTESLALKDVEQTISHMNQLRAAGIQIAMDDFGTGYSSLSYIQQLPFTMLKLDRQFVEHMEDVIVVQEIVSSVVRIAKAKNIRTIAEGVETPEQARQLRLSGCDYGQGYLYGKPLTAAEMEQLIRENAKHKMLY